MENKEKIAELQHELEKVKKDVSVYQTHVDSSLSHLNNLIIEIFKLKNNLEVGDTVKPKPEYSVWLKPEGGVIESFKVFNSYCETVDIYVKEYKKDGSLGKRTRQVNVKHITKVHDNI